MWGSSGTETLRRGPRVPSGFSAGGVERRGGLPLAAGRRHASERGPEVRAEDDRPRRTPGTVIQASGVGERLRTSGAQIDALEFALRAEDDRAAVGRPERF